jgi:hypothetical protein
MKKFRLDRVWQPERGHRGTDDLIRGATANLATLTIQHRQQGRILLSHAGDESCSMCDNVTRKWTGANGSIR